MSTQQRVMLSTSKEVVCTLREGLWSWTAWVSPPAALAHSGAYSVKPGGGAMCANLEECTPGSGNSKVKDTEAGANLVHWRSRSVPRQGRAVGYEVTECAVTAIQ